MDIYNNTSKIVSTKPGALESVLSKASPQPQKAEVTEVVTLSKSQIQELANKKILTDALQKQLLNHLAAANPKRKQDSTGSEAPLSLIKATIINANISTKAKVVWLLTELKLAKGSAITLLNKGDAFVALGTSSKLALNQGSATMHNTPSLAASINEATVNKHGTQELNLSAGILTASNSISNSAIRNNAGASSQISPSALHALLGQVLKLTLPTQDQNFQFFNRSQTLPNNSNGNIFRLAEQSLQPDLKQLAQLIQKLGNLAHTLPNIKSITSDQLQQLLLQNGATTKTSPSDSAHEFNALKQTSERNDNSIKALLESAVALFKRLDTTSSQFSKVESQLFNALVRLLAGIVPNKQDTNRNDAKHSAKQSLRALEHMAAGSLARILVNQARTALTGTTNDVAAQALQLETDVLVRHSDQVIPVHIALKEDKGAASGRHKQARKHKTWVVFLEWELEECGTYHTEIRVRDNTVSAKIWNQNTYIRQKLRDNISKLHETLTQNGIEVEALTCEEAPLVKPEIPMDRNLVDVRT